MAQTKTCSFKYILLLSPDRLAWWRPWMRPLWMTQEPSRSMNARYWCWCLHAWLIIINTVLGFVQSCFADMCDGNAQMKVYTVCDRIKLVSKWNVYWYKYEASFVFSYDLQKVVQLLLRKGRGACQLLYSSLEMCCPSLCQNVIHCCSGKQNNPAVTTLTICLSGLRESPKCLHFLLSVCLWIYQSFCDTVT